MSVALRGGYQELSMIKPHTNDLHTIYELISETDPETWLEGVLSEDCCPIEVL